MIDFTKFIDLLISHQLFFVRSDKLDDPFEGLLQLKDYDKNDSSLWLFDETKKYYFLNCWHINEHQSDAMWKIFLNTKNGIAIKTTIENLIKSIEHTEEDIEIAKIKYIDPDKVTFNQLLFSDENRYESGRGGCLNQFSYKRISFEHEKELRLYYIDSPIPHAIIDGVPREPISHKKIDVNLNLLIDELVIAPFADEWFGDLVEKTINKLSFNFKIVKSNLYKLK